MLLRSPLLISSFLLTLMLTVSVSETASAADSWAHAHEAMARSAAAELRGDLPAALHQADVAFLLHGDDAWIAARYLEVRERLARDLAGYAFQLVYVCHDRTTLASPEAEKTAAAACTAAKAHARRHLAARKASVPQTQVTQAR